MSSRDGWTPFDPAVRTPLPTWVEWLAAAIAWAIIMEAFVLMADLGEWWSGR